MKWISTPFGTEGGDFGDYSRIHGIDPSISWLFGPGIEDLMPGPIKAHLLPIIWRHHVVWENVESHIAALQRLNQLLLWWSKEVGERFLNAEQGSDEKKALRNLYRRRAGGLLYAPGPIFHPKEEDRLVRGETAVGVARKTLFDLMVNPGAVLDAMIEALEAVHTEHNLLLRYHVGVAAVRDLLIDAFEVCHRMEKELQVSPPMRIESIPSTPRRPADVDVDLKTGVAVAEAPVVVGIIDDGFSPGNTRLDERIGHMRLDDSNHRTRVVSHWRQGADFEANATVDFGKEILSWPLEPANQSGELYLFAESAGFAGDPELSRGLASAARVSHGAHLLDLMTGDDAPDFTVLERPIVCVELPRHVVRDTSGAQIDAYILGGVQHILDRAKAFAPAGETIPFTVINISYGYVAGARRPPKLLTDALDALIDEYDGRLFIVFAAGNSQIQRLHARINEGSADHSDELCWRVQPDDKTPSMLEIWPDGPVKDISVPPFDVELISPYGRVVGRLSAQTPHLQLVDERDRIIAAMGYHVRSVKRSGQTLTIGHFRVDIQPTGRRQKFRNKRVGTAPAGLWRLRVHRNGTEQDLNASFWIQRDDTLRYSRKAGRQSYFDQADYERFDSIGRVKDAESDETQSYVTRDDLLNVLSVGTKTLVIGASVGTTKKAAVYSPAGLPGSEPDYYASADDSLVHGGTFSSGAQDGSTVTLNGTSVAAPRVARKIVDALAAGIAPNDVRAHLDGLLDSAPARDPDELKGENRASGKILMTDDHSAPNSGAWHPRLPRTLAIHFD